METDTNEQGIPRYEETQENTEIRSGILPPAKKQRLPLWALIFGGTGLMIAAAVGIAYILVRDLKSEEAVAQASPTPLSAAALVTPENPAGGPVTTPGPAETTAIAPIPTFTPLPTAIVLPTPTPTNAPPQDVAADVVSLIGGDAVAEPPQGVDIAACNIAGDTQVTRDLPPAALKIGQTGGQLIVWLMLAQPVPESRTLDYHWLASLDVDANPETGRPKGDGYINPELGAEIGAGVFLYPDGELEPYLYIWDTEKGDWAADSEVPEIAEAALSETRDAVALIFPIVELNEALEEIAGVSLNPNLLKGRMATIASSNTEPAVVDFCPNLPPE